jgi:hypothetical protein
MIALTAVLVAIATLVYSLSVRVKDAPEAEPLSPVSALEEKKAAIYENLRDLQFEFRVGKLSDEDYQRAKLELQKELAGVLAKIDSLTGKPPEATPAPLHSPPPGLVCPKCGARFPQPMKFCGECGGAMSGGAA